MRRKWIFLVPAAIAGIALFSFIGGEIVKLLWNWLMPDLFGWRPVTFWQALGLLALCRILFGGMWRHGGRRMTSNMTPEERDRFRRRIREVWGFREREGGARPAEAREASEGGNML